MHDVCDLFFVYACDQSMRVYMHVAVTVEDTLMSASALACGLSPLSDLWSNFSLIPERVCVVYWHSIP